MQQQHQRSVTAGEAGTSHSSQSELGSGASDVVSVIPSCSDDDEDDDDSYYDAREDGLSPHGVKLNSDRPEELGSDMREEEDDDDDEEEEEDGVSSRKASRAEFDYDAMYGEEEEELESFENHGSVISHLISQVRIGMDLTKVVLPTFILERRSLLEMYADFFAHPDLFISIADMTTPESRFIQVVKWYLSAFHAGRKSSVAKKPYNPILGEVFKCRWDIPNYQRPDSGTGKRIPVRDGPVPDAPSSSLTFIAEQVSHHPPISAFYAEHPEKRIMFQAHIYTKSQFLGMSVGVHNIGRGSIYLMDREEEYIFNFPSAYGRSILTVPWIELGGSVSISCPQTMYHANVEFLTKVSSYRIIHAVRSILNPLLPFVALFRREEA